MPTKSAALRQLTPERSPSETRKRLLATTQVLSSSAKEIATKSRVRHYKSGSITALPSRKPRVVTKNNKVKDRSFIIAMRVFGVGVVFSLLSVVGIQTVIASRQIKINSIKTSQQNEITQYRKMRKDIAVLKSPNKINRRAQFLGLVQPTRFITINIPYKTNLRSTVVDGEFNAELKAILNGS